MAYNQYDKKLVEERKEKGVPFRCKKCLSIKVMYYKSNGFGFYVICQECGEGPQFFDRP